MIVEFWPDVAPATVENFTKLAKEGTGCYEDFDMSNRDANRGEKFVIEGETRKRGGNGENDSESGGNGENDSESGGTDGLAGLNPSIADEVNNLKVERVRRKAGR